MAEHDSLMPAQSTLITSSYFQYLEMFKYCFHIAFKLLKYTASNSFRVCESALKYHRLYTVYRSYYHLDAFVELFSSCDIPSSNSYRALVKPSPKCFDVCFQKALKSL